MTPVFLALRWFVSACMSVVRHGFPWHILHTRYRVLVSTEFLLQHRFWEQMWDYGLRPTSGEELCWCTLYVTADVLLGT